MPLSTIGSILALAVSEIMRFLKKASHEGVKVRAARKSAEIALLAEAFSLTSARDILRER